MLCLRREQTVTYFDRPYARGFLEGMNNRIKVIKRTAHGYRRPQNFRQRLLRSNRQRLSRSLHEEHHTYRRRAAS
jgi:transposase